MPRLLLGEEHPSMIPVIWATHNPESIARGYWDQGWLEALLDHSLWRPASAFEFSHYEVTADSPEGAAFDDVDGAVVVIPGRHNASLPDTAWLNRQLARLSWCLLIITGDEGQEFPLDRLLLPARSKVWAMGPRPGDPHDVDRVLASGWPPWYRGLLPDAPPIKALDVFLAGQDTHERRHDCFEALAKLDPSFEQSVWPSEGFTLGLAHGTYTERMAAAKIAPCPSGPLSPDSFRLFEALEAGAIPLADAATPAGPDPAFWTLVFGQITPIPEVADWATLPELVAEIIAGWPANANWIFAWWQAWKRRLALDFDATIEALHPTVNTPARRTVTPDDDITVIIPTSPTPQHPSTDHIVETIESVRARLPFSPIIVVADGVRPEQEHLRKPYNEYLRRLLWLTNRCPNVLPILLPEWRHQANAARAALVEVSSPLVLFVEHDTPLVGEIDWEGCAGMIRGGTANVIRFHHEAEVHPEHTHLMLDDPDDPDPQRRSCYEGEPLLRTIQWSQRPHLAHAMFYRDLLARYFAPESRTMIEDVLHGVVQDTYARHGQAGWEAWRLWLYAPDGDMKRSTHLDSRGDEPKGEMRFVYPGARPEGAPPETVTP